MNDNAGTAMRRAFFLDRDGVIIEQVGYIRDQNGVKLITGAAEALKLIHQNGILAVVVSNHSGIARKKFTLGELMAVQKLIYALLAEQGEKIDGYYFCPPRPACRAVSLPQAQTGDDIAGGVRTRHRRRPQTRPADRSGAARRGETSVDGKHGSLIHGHIWRMLK